MGNAVQNTVKHEIECVELLLLHLAEPENHGIDDSEHILAELADGALRRLRKAQDMLAEKGVI